MSEQLHPLNDFRMIVRALGCVLLIGALSAPAYSGKPDGVETWKITEGTLTINVRPGILNDHNIQLLPAENNESDRSTVGQPSSFLLHVAPGSTLLIDVTDRRFRIIRGSIYFDTGLVLRSPWLKRSLQKLSISPTRQEGDVRFILTTDHGGKQEGLIFRTANIRIDPVSQVLMIDTDLVNLTPELAGMTGQRKLADVSFGGMFLQVSFDRYRDGMLLPALETDTGMRAGGSAGTGVIGPDVIVASLQGAQRLAGTYSTLCGECLEFPHPTDVSECATATPAECITAFSVATTSCNIGDERAAWVAFTNEHPVIAQNMYRLKTSRFEQIGMAWIKHGFFALANDFCSVCLVPGKECEDTREPCEFDIDCKLGVSCIDYFGKELGVGCSDPYTTSLNAIQTLLGPRSDVNPFTGDFPYPFTDIPFTGIIARRLQVHNDDLDPSLNGGAQYFVEGHYVTADDALAGNGTNNVSFRPITVDERDVQRFDIFTTGTTRVERAAIRAWREADNSVVESFIQVPNEGLFILSAKAWELNNGLWRYEYALQNINSDRAGGSFSVPLPPGYVLENIDFHDVDYHSGEIFDITDWFATVLEDQIVWATTPHINDVNANALRWGTLYNFRFDANVAPQATTITLGLFKPGTPEVVEVASIGPSTGFVDCNSNGITDVCDIDCSVPGCNPPCGGVPDCNNNRIPDDCEPDCNGNTVADACDIAGDTSTDCNLNLIPDECDIATGISEDCDTNNVPDECETLPDSDQDGVVDCFDLCPFDTATPGSCLCPELDRCCFPTGFCIPDYPRDDCIATGGTPDCELSLCRDGCLLGDFEGDGDIDLHDVMHLQRCYSGSLDLLEFVKPPTDCLLRFDYDEDNDIDGLDLKEFIRDLKGPIIHEPIPCTMDGECTDDDACTTDFCENGACLFDPVPGCVPCEPVFICPPLEIVFVMDTSGSMADEAAALCENMDQIIVDLSADGTEVIPHFLGITGTGGSAFPCLRDNVVSLLGGEVPGDDISCPFPDGTSSYESWGPATAIIAERLPWTPEAVRIVVPISDEGPCNGSRPDGCNDPGDDRDSINNAIQIAVANNVVVSPITGTGSTDCVRTLAELLATETGGITRTTEDAQTDLPPAIIQILMGQCQRDDRCDDENACTDNDTCTEGACEGVTNFDDTFFCCNPLDRTLTLLDDNDDCTGDICDPDTGSVTHPTAADGTSCDDDNTCTDNDVCTGGVCDGVSNFDESQFCCRPSDRLLTPLDDRDDCTDDLCDGDSGVVNHPPSSAGTTCDDGELCTTEDVCDGNGVCMGTDINTLLCMSDIDCPEGVCNVTNKRCTCGNNIPELKLIALPSPNVVDTCYTNGQDLKVIVELGFSTAFVVGGGFVIDYDPSVLRFIRIDPGSTEDLESPFSIEMLESVDEMAGTIVYSISIQEGDQGVHGPEIMAAIQFETLASCADTSLCFTNYGLFSTVLIDIQGTSIPFIPLCTSDLTILTEKPAFVCPESVAKNVDIDSTIATVTWEPVTVISSCGEILTPICSAIHSNGVDIDHLIDTGGVFPSGVSEFSCAVTDSCGQTITCSWSVTIHPMNTVEVDLELSAIMSVFHQPLRRCIEFQFYSTCSLPPIVVEKNIDFGLPFSFTGKANRVRFDIPADVYQCVTARDLKHTLRSTADLVIIDGIYSAHFNGDPILGGNWLINGNLDGNDVIDIVDFGLILIQASEMLNPDTPCGTEGAHADINGDGIVDELDQDFVSLNFLTTDHPSCCDTTTGAAGSSPITEISFEELDRMGLFGLEKYDVNGDGLLSLEDLEGYTFPRQKVKKRETRKGLRRLDRSLYRIK